jgi:hypothetical protein
VEEKHLSCSILLVRLDRYDCRVQMKEGKTQFVATKTSLCRGAHLPPAPGQRRELLHDLSRVGSQVIFCIKLNISRW